jgi:hypothetical protein
MANAWGELSWNSGLWGEQSNAIAAPTGIDLTVSQGEAAGYPFPGWGSLSWNSGEWGNVSNSGSELTGFNLTTNSGNVGVSGEINEGWGRLEWGENAWGIAGDVLVTGIGVSAGIGTGSVTIDVTVDDVVTGQQLNIGLNSVTAFGLAEVFPTGFGLTTNLGTVDPAPDVMLTGIGLTASSGTVDAYNEQGWGRDAWGTEVWGAQGIWVSVSLTGFDLGVSSGVQEPWGINSWGGGTDEEWGGNAVTEVGILTIASPIGIQLDIAEGIVDPSPDATVVGIGLSASIAVGSVIEADANVSITGFGLEIAQGQAELDAVTFAVLTGQELEIALNSAVAGASAEVFPTGIELTIGLGSINIQSWQIVNTGSDVNWNIIDTAA